MLLGRDPDNMSNVHRNATTPTLSKSQRDRSTSFHINQIEDDYETQPLISKEQFFKRIRGRKGAFPPVRSNTTRGKASEKIPVYCCAQVNELTTIDTKSNTFTARLSLMLIFDIDVAGTTARLKEELEEVSGDEAKAAIFEDRQKKLEQWKETIDNSCEDGTPYKIEDEEYGPFEEEIEWPESLELFNKITEDQVEEPKFVILRNHPENAKSIDEVKTATVWIEFMEGLYECKEYQELEFFPFDLQDLTLDFQLTTRTDIDRFDFRLHTVEFYRPCLQMAEWVMYPPESDRKGTAKTSVRLRATRKSRYYITNIVGMMCILNCMCIAAFGIEVPDIADRLSVTMTMMLTAVAFKFIVGDQLPKVSYNTYLDFYLLYTMFFMFSVSIYFCFGPHLWKAWFSLDDIGGDPGEPVVTDVKDADRIICLLFSVMFVLFTGYWFWGAWFILREIQEELPPPINLEDGVEYISYRWQQVPFHGFENPSTELQKRGGKFARTPDPENIDRLISLSSIDSYNTKLPSVGETPHKGTKAGEFPAIAVHADTKEAPDFENFRDENGGEHTEADTPSTFQIEKGSLPSSLNGEKTSSKRTPETPH